MEPAVSVALLWAVFAVTHIGLATAAVRARLVEMLGETGFAAVYSAVASVSLALLVGHYAAHRFEGAAGPSLGAFPAARWALIALLTTGVVFMTATFWTYGRSPYAVVGRDKRPSARGLQRVTRHPFFAGLALMALAHSLLATHLVGSVFMIGFAFVAIVGSWHQDRKLRARLGAPLDEYLRETSAVPFLAILSGRQKLVWREISPVAILAGLAVTVALRAVHDGIFAWGGMAFVMATIGGAIAFSIAALRTAERRKLEERGARAGDRRRLSA